MIGFPCTHGLSNIYSGSGIPLQRHFIFHVVVLSWSCRTLVRDRPVSWHTKFDYTVMSTHYNTRVWPVCCYRYQHFKHLATHITADFCPTYNTWMCVKETYLKHVFNTVSCSDDTGIMLSLYWYWFSWYWYYVFLYNGIKGDAWILFHLGPNYICFGYNSTKMLFGTSSGTSAICRNINSTSSCTNTRCGKFSSNSSSTQNQLVPVPDTWW